MKKTVTKALIIKALKTEPLKDGDFFRAGEVSFGKFRYRKNCKVCAVGAVLRHASFETWARGKKIDLYDMGARACAFPISYDDIDELLRDKDYMSALSSFFESRCDDGFTEQVRIDTIQFVKKHFPAKVTIDIGDYWDER